MQETRRAGGCSAQNRLRSCSESREPLNRARRMVNSALLEVLCCPETHQQVRLAEPPLLERLNREIASGALKNRAGKPVSEKLAAGLIRADGQWLYPIRND